MLPLCAVNSHASCLCISPFTVSKLGDYGDFGVCAFTLDVSDCSYEISKHRLIVGYLI